MSIYLIRHAQSEFNAIYDPDKPDPMIFDARLSSLGESQAAQARASIQQLDITHLIVSPLTRTLQTAALLFEGTKITTINSLVREQVLNSCDIGRAPHQLAQEYPHLDFDHLAECWWHDEEKDHRGISVEPDATLQQRADEFAGFLKENNACSTAVISHGNFIRALTGIQPDNCEVIEFTTTGK